jgi:transcriptional regulator with XRE-family HTH domain
MPRGDAFFTPEMGRRLRELRLRKGLTQVEVARRMGLKGKGGKGAVFALESARSVRPYLDTITRYLNACGALFSEFYDTLTRTVPLPVEPEARELMARVPDLGSNYGATFQKEVRQKLVTQTADQVHKYQSRTERPLGGEPPMKPERQRKAAEGFRQYRMQLNIIEQAVKDMLQADEDKAIAEHRKPAVRYYQHLGYLMLARKILGVLRRNPKENPTTDKHRRAPTRILAEEDTRGNSTANGRRRTPTDATGEHSPSSQHEPEAGTCEAQHPAQVRRSRKTLEERLGDAMWFAQEQQLNMEAAEQVRALVVETYAKLRA